MARAFCPAERCASLRARSRAGGFIGAGAEFIEIRLIVRSAPVHVIEIKSGSPVVDKPVWVVLLLQATGWIKREVMIDELPKIGEESRDATLFGIRAVFRLIFGAHHIFGEGVQIRARFHFGGAELRRRKRSENPPECAAKEYRTTG